jgi:hypothetical protein
VSTGNSKYFDPKVGKFIMNGKIFFMIKLYGRLIYPRVGKILRADNFKSGIDLIIHMQVLSNDSYPNMKKLVDSK